MTLALSAMPDTTTDLRQGPPRSTARRADYTPPDFLVEALALRFELDADCTRVYSRMTLCSNPIAQTPQQAGRELLLDGEQLMLESLRLDGCTLHASDYRLEGDRLIVPLPAALAHSFTLEIVNTCNPAANTALSGLYQSGENLYTQCEAEGFRRITYYPDRPDVMTRFSVTLLGDPERYPVMLCNGNKVAEGVESDGRHWVRWEDPHPKPCYLFALVAGKLIAHVDRFITCTGREVRLEIWVAPADLIKCAHAMDSLKHAMRWDEERFGLIYDLDLFMIVAVADFNMGAMENKGLNIFNAACVLASPRTATDGDYASIEAVIAHEYFHNWTGNRVTCRDWFQLSLKEGLTVFRDQLFSADRGSAAACRINQVRMLRSYQFAEDAGPMAHPVRPEHYVEINNFYTATVYEKGAEVVRMYQTLLGRAGFRRGMELYFQRHDGQAVTCDDFRAAMADANAIDLSQFERWYTQAGTPQLAVKGHYDAVARTYTLEITQSTQPTPDAPTLHKQPLMIPFALGLLGRDGQDLPLHLVTERTLPPSTATVCSTRDHLESDPVVQETSAAIAALNIPPSPGTLNDASLLVLTETQHRFVFRDLAEEPTPSLLRGFSAPVRCTFPYTRAQLVQLMAYDSDTFNRWDAGQRLLLEDVNHWIAHDIATPQPLESVIHAPQADLLAALRRLLDEAGNDAELVSAMLVLPAWNYLADQQQIIHPLAISSARLGLQRGLARTLCEPMLACYHALASNAPYRYSPEESARRTLRNTLLGYLSLLEDDARCQSLARTQFEQAGGDGAAANMTDYDAAFGCLVRGRDAAAREAALAHFLTHWQHDALVMDGWFSTQMSVWHGDIITHAHALLGHPAFAPTNPNKVRALIGGLLGNPTAFHAADGSGYRFASEQILRLDPLNPQLAAGLTRAFNRWRKLEPTRSALMHTELEHIAACAPLSPDVYEVVTRNLAAAEATV